MWTKSISKEIFDITISNADNVDKINLKYFFDMLTISNTDNVDKNYFKEIILKT